MDTIYRATKTHTKEEGTYEYWLQVAKKFYKEVNLNEIDHHRANNKYASYDLATNWFDRLTKVFGLEVV